MVKDFTPEALTQADYDASKCATEGVEVIAQAEILKELGKDLLSGIKTRLEKEHGKEISETRLERLARSTDEWSNFRRGQFAATKSAMAAKVRSHNAERRFEALQSGLSYRKEELRRLSGH